MGDMTTNFSRHEFRCKGRNCCAGSAPINPALVAALQELRDLVGRGLKINSGFRCLRHNRLVGSDDASQHVLGMAADVATPGGLTAAKLAALAELVPAFEAGGIGVYPWGVHVDIRGRRVRWNGR